MNHTPTPWVAEYREETDEALLFFNAHRVAVFNSRLRLRGHALLQSDYAAAAMQTVTEVAAKLNAHDELVAALDGCIDSQECNGYIGVQILEEARAALAKAQAPEQARAA